MIQTVSKEEMQPMLRLDQILFQAIQPDTNVFLWHSVQWIDDKREVYDLLTYVGHFIDFKCDSLDECSLRTDFISISQGW